MDSEGKQCIITQPCGNVMRIRVEFYDGEPRQVYCLYDPTGSALTCWVRRVKRSRARWARRFPNAYREITSELCYLFRFIQCSQCKTKVSWTKFKEPIL